MVCAPLTINKVTVGGGEKEEGRKEGRMVQ